LVIGKLPHIAMTWVNQSYHMANKPLRLDAFPNNLVTLCNDFPATFLMGQIKKGDCWV